VGAVKQSVSAIHRSIFIAVSWKRGREAEFYRG
jgi:hypothetical protein